MEWNFRINWQLIVGEAKQRRKKQGLTQQRLAILADVSTPTISNFENGDRNILVDSVLKILGVLGMNEDKNLVFEDKPAENKLAYDPMRMIVISWAKDGDKKIRCAISWEALQDHFGLSSITKDPLKAFESNKATIEHEFRRKYIARNLEEDGTVLVRTGDL